MRILLAVVVLLAFSGCGPTVDADCSSQSQGEAEGVQEVVTRSGKAVAVCRNGRVYVLH